VDVVKLIHYQKWTDRTVNYHAHGFIQEVNSHYIDFKIFGFWWKKAITWDEHINYFPNDWDEKPY
jgi:hypothetical protein